MALSNWDTLAVDLDGKPINGVFISPSGVQVEVYKNFLYVRDPAAWRESAGYAEPTVMEITEGALRYMDVSMAVKRGPQSGVYAVVWTPGYYYTPKDKRDFREPARGMVGVGVYGYVDDDEAEFGARFEGVQPESINWLVQQLRGKHTQVDPIKSSTQDENGKWVTETHQLEVELWDWDDLGLPDQVRTLDFGGALRFNQGDAFFADHIGVDTGATPPGEAEPTVLSQIVESWKEESTNG